jgi:transcriptional regulator with XRE-family HTH domain
MAAKSLPGFGARLRELRERMGLSQPELATRLGVHPSDISRWERDLTFPRGAALRDLCVTIGASADYMLGLHGPPGEESEALRRFRGTRWGKIAADHGWIEHLRDMPFPMAPTVELYRDIVKSMLDMVEPDSDE